MKINEGFILKEIEGVGGETKYVVITVGKASEKIGGMITLNETLKDIWNLIEAGKTKDQIIDEMVKRYDVTREAFSLDLDKILADLKAAGIFNDD